MWYDLKGFEDRYMINKNGEIYSKLKQIIMKNSIDKNGYKIIHLSKSSTEKKNFKVHRLVAIQFIPTKDETLQVNHKDGIKSNNTVSNLEWITCKENINHAHKNKLATNKHKRVPVEQYDMDWNFIARYNSCKEAGLKTGINPCNIEEVISGRIPKNRPNPRQSAGGYRWKRVTTIENKSA